MLARLRLRRQLLTQSCCCAWACQSSHLPGTGRRSRGRCPRRRCDPPRASSHDLPPHSRPPAGAHNLAASQPSSGASEEATSTQRTCRLPERHISGSEASEKPAHSALVMLGTSRRPRYCSQAPQHPAHLRPGASALRGAHLVGVDDHGRQKEHGHAMLGVRLAALRVQVCLQHSQFSAAGSGVPWLSQDRAASAAAGRPCLQEPVGLIRLVAAHTVDHGGDVQAHGACHLVRARAVAKAPTRPTSAVRRPDRWREESAGAPALGQSRAASACLAPACAAASGVRTH